MQFIRRLWQLRPRPFLAFQRYMDIEQEWSAFKSNISPHKFKLTLTALILSYPLYKPYLNNCSIQIKKFFAKLAGENLAKEQPARKVAQNLVKELVDDVLKDKNIKIQAADFVSDLSKREKVTKGVLDLLLAVIKNPVFIEQSKSLGTRIVISNANDSRVEQQLKQLVLRILKSYEIQLQVQQIIKLVFSSQTAINTLVKLLISAINDQSVQNALGNAVKYSFRELLHDQETVEQFKLFGEYVLHEFEKDVEKDRIVNVLEMRGIGLERREKDLAFLSGLQSDTVYEERPTN